MANFPGEPSINTMKHQIQNVIDSYHNDYDVLSELLQNAVDAIEKRREIDSKFTGKIEIQINSDLKEIVVIDNGIGMSKDMLDRAVQVNESGKIDDPKTIGEKGVGLSFTIFNSGYAEIISTDDKETTRIVATNANL
ncbi:ATP-binding protein [Weissella confusa]|uniref:ATP-binding protein n=1 Tax=Weissella confusa TaxID=1583 RepID=UPI00223BB3C1|nr:ATP-binding protein [Weissella confusa]